MWVLTCAYSPAHSWAASRHGAHVFNRHLTGSNRASSSSCGVVFVGGAGSSGVDVNVIVVTIAAAAVTMQLMVLVYRDGWWE